MLPTQGNRAGSRLASGVLVSLIALLVLLTGAAVMLDVLDDSLMLGRSTPAASDSPTNNVETKAKL